jgi:hypothetical protein
MIKCSTPRTHTATIADIYQDITNDKSIPLATYLAQILGISAAVILQQLHFYIKCNIKDSKKQQQTFKEDTQWTYCTLEKLWESIGKCRAIRTISRALNKLKDLGIIIMKHFSKNRFDRTGWYTIDYERLKQYISERTCSPNGVESHYDILSSSDDDILSSSIIKNSKENKIKDSIFFDEAVTVKEEQEKGHQGSEVELSDPPPNEQWMLTESLTKQCTEKYPHLSAEDIQNAAHNFVMYHTNKMTQHLISDVMFLGWCKRHYIGCPKWVSNTKTIKQSSSEKQNVFRNPLKMSWLSNIFTTNQHRKYGRDFLITMGEVLGYEKLHEFGLTHTQDFKFSLENKKLIIATDSPHCRIESLLPYKEALLKHFQEKFHHNITDFVFNYHKSDDNEIKKMLADILIVLGG